jgi:hypothetical protein
MKRLTNGELEFYSVHSSAIGTIIRPAAHLTRAIAIAAALLAAACATVQPGPAPAPPPPTAPPLPRTAEPPPPTINLSGFPLPYRQGYADGCASVQGAERKDAARFAGDPNYRTGWQDGLALCRKK